MQLDSAAAPALVGGAGRVLNAPVQVLGLSQSALAALHKLRIYVVGELCRCAPADLPADLRDGVVAALTPHGLGLMGAAAPNPSHLPLLAPVPVPWVPQPVEELDLTKRTCITLHRAGVTTVGRLCQMTPRALLALDRFTHAALLEVRLACLRRGLFGPQPDVLPLGEAVASLKLTTRALNILLRAGIRTLDQLCAMSGPDLRLLPEAGMGMVREVRRALSRIGRTLADGTPTAPDAGGGLGPLTEPGTLDDLLAVLMERQPPRARRVLLLRFGLYSGGPLTTDQVAARLGLSQYEGRQLLGRALLRMDRAVPDRLGRLCREVAAMIRSAGGVAPLADVAAAIAYLYPASGLDPEGFARLVLPHCRELVGRAGDRWALAEADGMTHAMVVSTLEGLLAQEGFPLPLAELLDRACARLDGVDPLYMEVCLQSSPPFRLLSGDQVALAGWYQRRRSHTLGLRRKR